MGNARTFRLVGIAAVCSLLSACGGAKQSSPDAAVPNPQDLSGIWWDQAGTPALKPMNTSSVPLKPESQGRLEANAAKLKAPPSGPADVARCAPAGVPRVWTQPFPFEFLQKPDFIAIVYEHNRMFRVIYMNQPVPSFEEADPAYLGHSVGRWEGDTLVVETVGFNDRTSLDDTGLPHGEKLKVTERIRKIKEGNALEVQVTIDDPDTFTQPWSTRLEFARNPEAKIEEYICGYGVFETRTTRATRASAQPAAQ